MDTIRPQNTGPRLPFHTPSESICDRVYAEEAHRPDASMVDTDYGDDPDSEQTEETSEETLDPIIVRSYRQSVNPVQTQHAPSGETSNLLVSERCLHSPYRSQSPMDTPAYRATKCRLVLFKQKEKKPSHTVYITLDSFKQGQQGSQMKQMPSKDHCDDDVDESCFYFYKCCLLLICASTTMLLLKVLEIDTLQTERVIH